MKPLKVKKFGNSGHVVLSKNLVGKYIRIITVDDDILGLGEIQRLKFKIETFKSNIGIIRRNNRLRNREEILSNKRQALEHLEKILAASEKASQEADMVR